MHRAVSKTGSASVAAPHRQLSSVSHVGLKPTPCRPAPLAPPPSRRIVSVEMGRRAAKIAARKGKSDSNKSKLNGRFGKKIIASVKQGGDDIVGNAKLGDILKQAKMLGVPKDVIDRNLKKAIDKNQADYQELCYEAYGPGGTGFIIECLTDNVNRSASEVKRVITKTGCKVAEPGSVAFLFTRCGMLVVEGSEEAVFEAAMEAGAEDIVPVPTDEEEASVPTSYRIYTPPEEFASSSASMERQGFSVNGEESGLVYKANADVEVDDDIFAICETLLERLLELDDVDAVYSNCDGLDS